MKKLSIPEIKRRLSGIGEPSGRRCYNNGSPVPWDAQYSYPRPDCFHSKGYVEVEPNRKRISRCAAELDIEGMPHLHVSEKTWKKAWRELYRDVYSAVREAVYEIENERRGQVQ